MLWWSMVVTHYYASAPSKVLLEGDVVAVVEMFLNDGYEACQQSKGKFTTRSNPRILGFNPPPLMNLTFELDIEPKLEN